MPSLKVLTLQTKFLTKDDMLQKDDNFHISNSNGIYNEGSEFGIFASSCTVDSVYCQLDQCLVNYVCDFHS